MRTMIPELETRKAARDGADMNTRTRDPDIPELTPEAVRDFIETMPEGTVASVDLEGVVLRNG